MTSSSGFAMHKVPSSHWTACSIEIIPNLRTYTARKDYLFDPCPFMNPTTTPRRLHIVQQKFDGERIQDMQAETAHQNGTLIQTRSLWGIMGAASRIIGTGLRTLIMEKTCHEKWSPSGSGKSNRTTTPSRKQLRGPGLPETWLPAAIRCGKHHRRATPIGDLSRT